MKFDNRFLLGFLALVFLNSCKKDDLIKENDTSVNKTDTVEIVDSVELPPRCDSRPETTMGIPHHQIGVELVKEVNEELFRRVYSLPGIKNKPSVIANWRSLWLTDEVNVVVPEAVINGSREFGHIHDDGSLHIFLEPNRAAEAVADCWGINHPFAAQQTTGWDGFVLLYTPQSINELNVTFQLIVDGYNNATGQNLLATDYY